MGAEGDTIKEVQQQEVSIVSAVNFDGISLEEKGIRLAPAWPCDAPRAFRWMCILRFRTRSGTHRYSHCAAFYSDVRFLLGFSLLLHGAGMTPQQLPLLFRRSRGRRPPNVTHRSACR